MPGNGNGGWYAAFKAKDSRFDGRFFIGVSSTGIYCRPVCRAKMPKAENCTYYSTAAEAEQAGYRPCLLCRPELAPGMSVTDATTTLARRAARLMEESCAAGERLEEVAGRLGCTSRHLRRAFKAEYNVSPVQYLQTCRLLLAKNLLTDTGLSVLDVAMAAGFGSLRRFNELFKKQYRLPPTALRKLADREGVRGGDITILLGYRPPYQWRHMLDFLAQRAIFGVEAVSGDKYMRTVRLEAEGQGQVFGWIKVGNRPEKSALAVTVSASLLPVLPQVLARVRSLFDLYCDPQAVF
ncbi:helix-turn-helix domain-containing protein, partial [Christensenellaceae bacterium OttesenSCG-928-K19]|nr:helix-turn-helix domain-containing protein [Christensenellaceae bacterium OttesenSCG-928-K19]